MNKKIYNKLKKMIVNENNLNENLINNNVNTDIKQEQLSIEETATKSQSSNNINININNNNLNTIANNNNKEIIYQNNNNNINKNISSINNKGDDNMNEIIEDDIKPTDTINLSNQKKKKKIDENELVYFEGDEDLDSELKEKNKTKSKNNFRYHISLNKDVLKNSTLVTIIIYILLTIISCIVFHQRRKKDPYLFCFKFLDRIPDQSQDMANKDVIYFLTDLNSFYIIHLVLLFIFISVCIMLIKGTKSEINNFFNNMSYFFLSTLILNIPILFSGMFTEKFYGSFLQPIGYTILTLISCLAMGKIFIVAKRHKYKNISSLINISILSSFMSAYQCYSFLFCLTYFYMNFYNKNESDQENMIGVEFIAGSIYFCIGIVVLTVFKDIFFVIAMVIIENGLLYCKRKSEHTIAIALFNISIVALNFASIIILIFNYNKKLFRLKEQK